MIRPALLLLCAACLPMSPPSPDADVVVEDAGAADAGACSASIDWDGVTTECPSPDGGLCVDAPLPDGGRQVFCDGENGSVCVTDRACRSGQCSFPFNPPRVCIPAPECVVAGRCGDGGTCVSVVTSSTASVVCSSGLPGDPCARGTDCQSNDCELTVTAVGVTRACR